MPTLQTFATLSPIPGFMPWLLSNLELQAKSCGGQCEGETRNVKTLKDNFLSPSEERFLVEEAGGTTADSNAVVLLLNSLTSPMHEWTKSEQLQEVMKPILLRLCTRYLLQEKKRGKALDAVTNFHAQNGATVERLNWMGDRSEHGLIQSAGIMVNYIYRLDRLEEYSRLYADKGLVSASTALDNYLWSPSLNT